MYISDAVSRAVRGEKIRDGGLGEWVTSCSSGTTLRYQSNRQVVTLTVANLLSNNWQCGLDFLMISRSMLHEILECEGLTPETIQRIVSKVLDNSTDEQIKV